MNLNIDNTYINQKIWVENKITQEKATEEIEKYRKNIIKLMDDDLRSWTKYEKIKNDLKYDVVWNIWVISYKWVPNSFYKYSKINWLEYYTNVPWLEKTSILKFWERESWYELNNWKLFKNWKEISQFLNNWNINYEYVKWIDNLNFYLEIQDKFWLMKTVMEGDKIEIDNIIPAFYNSIISWVLRIKDIMYFKSHWYIKDEDFPKLLKRAITELPNQCSDTRFYQNAKWVRMWMEVTKEELDEYLHPTKWQPLITKEMYDECLKNIQKRDAIINSNNKTKEVKSNVKIENTKKGILDKIKDILGF